MTKKKVNKKKILYETGGSMYGTAKMLPPDKSISSNPVDHNAAPITNSTGN
jgi:hypothetical protein